MIWVLYRKIALALLDLTARIQSVWHLKGSSVQQASITSDYFVYHKIIAKNNIPKAWAEHYTQKVNVVLYWG